MNRRAFFPLLQEPARQSATGHPNGLPGLRFKCADTGGAPDSPIDRT